MDRFSENQFDFCISNYPFSLKINELSEMEKSNILNDEVLNKFFKNNKLTGVCDFLFIIKIGFLFLPFTSSIAHLIDKYANGLSISSIIS